MVRAVVTLSIHRLGRGRWLLDETAHCPGGIWVVLADQGSVGMCVGPNTLNLDEHHMFIAGNAAPLTVIVPDGARVVAVLLPSGASDLPLPSGSNRGLLIRDRRGSTSGILAHILRGLALDDHGGFREHDRRVCEQLSFIARMACTEEAPAGRSDMHALFTASTEIVENRLWDEALDAEALAARLNVSTRTLHRAFRAQGASVSLWIRERRLDRCREDLLDPKFSHLSVSAIAAQWGLRDAAHFSRLFKARFGDSPRNFRVIGSQDTDGVDGHFAPGHRVFA